MYNVWHSGHINILSVRVLASVAVTWVKISANDDEEDMASNFTECT